MFNDIPILLADFLSYMDTIKGKSKSTVKEYYYDLRLFLKYIKFMNHNVAENTIDEINILDINLDHLKSISLSDLYSFMSYLSYDRNNSTRSRARKVASIKSFYNYLQKKVKILDNNPASELETPKLSKKQPSYLSIEESVSLLSAISGRHEKRDYAIITLFLNCGMRLSELVNINISRIKKDTITILGKGNKERTIYLNEACLDAINTYLTVRKKIKNEHKDALFLSERNRRISNKTIQHLVKKFITLSGLDPNKFSTHKLRHTAATLLYQHGKVDIRALQEILGHESISTTEIYTHISSKQLKDAINQNPLSKLKRRN